MSDSDFSTTDKKNAPKKSVSPGRNVFGIVVLLAVIAVGVFQYLQLFAFNSTVSKLEARANDENKSLMTVPEAEGLLGKAADGPGVDFVQGPFNFTKKTYTWTGVIKSYTLTAYYTKEKESHFHHFETEGAKLPPEVVGQERIGHSRSAPTDNAPPVAKPGVDIVDSKATPAPPPRKSEREHSKPAGADSKPAQESKPASDSKAAPDSKTAPDPKTAPDSKTTPAPAPAPAKDEK